MDGVGSAFAQYHTPKSHDYINGAIQPFSSLPRLSGHDLPEQQWSHWPPSCSYPAGWMDAVDGVERQTSTVIHIKIRLQIFVPEICHVTIRKLKWSLACILLICSKQILHKNFRHFAWDNFIANYSIHGAICMHMIGWVYMKVNADPSTATCS